MRMRRRSASEEMLTRVEEGCWGVVSEAIFCVELRRARDVFWRNNYPIHSNDQRMEVIEQRCLQSIQ